MSENELQQEDEGEVGSDHELDENNDMDTEPFGSSDVGSGSSECEALCCATFDTISQPRDKALLRKTRSTKSGRTRCFLPSWYDQFKWVHFCQSRLKAFCFYCMKARGSSTQITRTDQVFASSGFSNWEKMFVSPQECSNDTCSS